MAREKFTIVRENNSGCSGFFIIMDFIIIFMVLSEYIGGIHTVFRLVLAFVMLIVMFMLMKVKYLGVIVQILVSIFWGDSLEYMMEWFYTPSDKVWLWFWRVVFFIISFGAHALVLNPYSKEDIEI